MTPLSITTLSEMKQRGEKIACMTAYYATFARMLDAAGVDVILVGDSLGMVIQGHDTTLPVRVQDMVYHSAAVRRGTRRALLVADMPFMSYASPSQAWGNAARLIGEGGAHAVKLEGGSWLTATVSALTMRGIVVCGHLGLTPQSLHALGGYRVQGRSEDGAKRLKTDARALEAAGAKLLVLECVPRHVAADVSASVRIPVIGIGAGVDCDGQVLVLHDALGLNSHPPRFVRNFLAAGSGIARALGDYVAAVKTCEFPADEHGFD